MLLVATYDDAGALPPHDDDVDATLPSGMRAVGLVALADELRAEAGEVLASFAAAGVNVKIISGDDPDTVVALARQAGILDVASIAGHELDDLDELGPGQGRRGEHRLRPDHPGPEGAAGRCAQGAAGTTWR